MNLFSDEARRNPFPIYQHLRRSSPVLHDPQSGLWMVFTYEGVKRVLYDHEAFSSRVGPVEWMIFLDPPRHTKLRALVSQAFTPRSIANLEHRILQLSRELLARAIDRGEMDLAADYAIPLPMMVIAEMLGIPVEDRERFKYWNDVILKMSYTIPGGQPATGVYDHFVAITAEMDQYLGVLLKQRRAAPREDLLSRLLGAQVDGERLSQQNILGFFQLLLLAGQETTTNLINNTVLSLLENQDQLGRLRQSPALLPTTIEEVLRYRSPLQWMIRLSTRDVELHGVVIPAKKVVLAMIGSANHDETQFDQPERFNISRDPNPHIAFGHGMHFCLGAALSRLEARVAVRDLLALGELQLANDEPWEPRKGLHVHGPSKLPIRFRQDRKLAAGAESAALTG
jgi:cytochrome P450